MGVRIPMRRRLPNPPPVFVGREAEVERLRMIAQRGPVSIVVGHDGIGKSALVQQTLKQPSSWWTGPVVVLPVHPEDPLEDALVMALQVLAPGTDEPFPKHSEALLDALLKAAEQHEALVVFEDLAPKFSAHPSVITTLKALAGHADRSRWMLTCVATPEIPELAEQVMPLGSLGSAASRTLAHHCGARDDAVDRVVTRADGFPLAIRQGAMNAETLDDVSRISASAIQLLRVLAQVRQPLSRQSLEKIGIAMPADEELVALENAGWLQRDGDARSHLPEFVRHAIDALVDEGERTDMRQRLASGLADLDDEDAQFQAFDAALEGRLEEQAKAVIEAHGQLWISRGRAGRVWRRLKSYTDSIDTPQDIPPTLASWALRMACATGSSEALEWAAAYPKPDSACASFPPWLEAKILRGAYEDVLKATEGAQVQAHLDPERLVRRARALLALGQIQEAAEILEQLAPDDEAIGCMRDAHLSKAYMLMGDYQQATALSRGIQSRLSQLSQNARMAVEFERTLVELALGNRSMTPKFEAPKGMKVGLDRAKLMEAIHAVLCAELVRAEQLVLEMGSLPSPFDQASRLLIQGVLHALRGRVPEAHSAITAGLEEARHHAIWAFYPWAMLLHDAIDGLLDACWQPLAEAPVRQSMPLVESMKLVSQYQRALNLLPDSPEQWPPAPSIPQRASRESPMTTLSELSWMRVFFMRGDYEQADLFCTTALRRAAQSGWTLLEQLAWMVRVPVVVGLGKRDPVETTLETLERMTAREPQHVAKDWVRLWRAATPPVPDVRTIFDIARDGTLPAQSIAQVLLNPGRPRFGFRRACLAAAQGCWTRASVRLRRGANNDFGACWVLDLVGQRLTSPTLETLDLKRSKLGLRILTALGGHDGVLEKEALALMVWGLSSYNPQRDDNRLHVALTRLRKFLGKLPDAQGLIESCADGYSLANHTPIIVLLPKGGLEDA